MEWAAVTDVMNPSYQLSAVSYQAKTATVRAQVNLSVLLKNARPQFACKH
jgi:hypothetical protein